MMRSIRNLLGALAALVAGPTLAQTYTPPAHSQPVPFFATATPDQIAYLASTAATLERDRPAAALLAEHRRLDKALAALAPQRRGVVDAYVLVVGLDSDAVFGREAREAARVLARRYGAQGRTILLAGTDGAADSAYPMGSPANIDIALARIAEAMDPAEDVLILYTTSHGAPYGIVYNDGDQGYGAISPSHLWGDLSALGIRNRMILVSACFSGVFVPMLASDTTAIVTAASAEKTSFGCQADSDWTFFGDALVNHALRKPQPFAAATGEAIASIAGWEARGGADAVRSAGVDRGGRGALAGGAGGAIAGRDHAGGAPGGVAARQITVHPGNMRGRARFGAP